MIEGRLLEKSNATGRWAFTIGYEESGKTIAKCSYVADKFTNDVIKDAVRKEIISLTAENSKEDTSTIQVGDVIDLSPVVVVIPDPTPEQAAQAKFLSDYRQLQSLLRAANAGFIDIADKRITDLQASTKAAWLDSYVGLI